MLDQAVLGSLAGVVGIVGEGWYEFIVPGKGAKHVRDVFGLGRTRKRKADIELTGSRDITVAGKGWVDQVNSAARAFHAPASARAGVYYRENKWG